MECARPITGLALGPHSAPWQREEEAEMSRFDYQLIGRTPDGRSVLLLPLCEAAAEWGGRFDCGAFWADAGFIAEAYSAGFTFC
jgi:hypothetical protein